MACPGHWPVSKPWRHEHRPEDESWPAPHCRRATAPLAQVARRTEEATMKLESLDRPLDLPRTGRPCGLVRHSVACQELADLERRTRGVGKFDDDALDDLF
jgi:hypothetical protein